MGWKIIIVKFFLIVALLFTLQSKSPFNICLRLIFIVINLGLLTHFLGRVWLIYTLVIIFLGGIIIVFVYASSVNNNFKLYISFSRAFIYSRIIRLWIIWVAWPENFLWKGRAAVWVFSVSSSYSYITFLAFIILLRLFIIVKMVQLEQGPLKM